MDLWLLENLFKTLFLYDVKNESQLLEYIKCQNYYRVERIVYMKTKQTVL